MKALIRPSKINGEVNAPSSKSMMQRACALAVLNNGTTHILHPGNCKDAAAALQIVKDLGALVLESDQEIIIKSTGNIYPASVINFKESGLCSRMFVPIISLSNQKTLVQAEGTLLSRPLVYPSELFSLLHTKITTSNGQFPVEIQGPLMPADITIDGSQSSQFLTGLLFSFASAVQKPVVITVNNLVSKPYIDLSIQLLHHFGYVVTHEAYQYFTIHPVKKIARDIIIDIEGDWSNAAFLMVAAALAGEIMIKGLDMQSKQADKSIYTVMKNCGAKIVLTEQGIRISKTDEIVAFEFDATDCPDLFPPLVCLASFCKGTSVIKGVSRLIHKESNRAESLCTVFGKMGTHLWIENNAMKIEGNQHHTAGEVSAHNDHRIAMAAAVAGLAGKGELTILGAEAVDKSFPEFYNTLMKIGGSVSLIKE